MNVWGWVGAIAAGWFAASLVLAAGWWLFKRTSGARPVPGDTHLTVVYDEVYDAERDGGL